MKKKKDFTTRDGGERLYEEVGTPVHCLGMSKAVLLIPVQQTIVLEYSSTLVFICYDCLGSARYPLRS